MTFDEQGNLYPYQLIDMNWATFEKKFVTDFPNSQTRQPLWSHYKQFADELKHLVKGAFYQWIDGSFLTQKNNPMDIDVVIFVDYLVFHQQKLLFTDTLSLKAEKGLDVYFVLEYPIEHPLYFVTELDKAQWLSVFGYSKRTVDNKIHRKGIVELQME